MGSRICTEGKREYKAANLLVFDGMGSPPSCRWGPSNNKEVENLKKADKPNVVIYIEGDNNKVTFCEGKSFLPLAIATASIALVILAIFLCFPDLRADIVRLIISAAINS